MLQAMALQTCQHVPDDWNNVFGRRTLHNISHELKEAVVLSTENMMVMMAEEMGKKYYSSKAENSYMSVSSGKRCTRQHDPTSRP